MNNELLNESTSPSINPWGPQNDYERERDEKFDELADAQRGAPETAMLRCQMHILGAGIGPKTMEHVGDLTHRMAENFSSFKGQYANVKDKVDKTLGWLTSGYGFAREVEENIRANYRVRAEENDPKLKGRSFEELKQDFFQRWDAYAVAHAKLTVYNDLQRDARAAAVCLGRRDFNGAINRLMKIKEVLDQGREFYIQKAGEFIPGKTASISNGLLDWSTPVEGLTVSLKDLQSSAPDVAENIIRFLKTYRDFTPDEAMLARQVPIHWLPENEFPFYENNHHGVETQEKIKELMRAIEEGKKLPPALLFPEQSNEWYDGNHRVKAALRLGLQKVPVLYLMEFAGHKRKPKSTGTSDDELYNELLKEGFGEKNKFGASVTYPKNSKTYHFQPLSFEDFLKKEGFMDEAMQMDEIELEMKEYEYDENVEHFGTLDFPVTIYRALEIPEGQSIDFDDVGVYWTWVESSADAYWGGSSMWSGQSDKSRGTGQRGEMYIIKAQVLHPNDVDWQGTLRANFIDSEENELRLVPGAQLKLIGVQGPDDGYTYKPVPGQMTITAATAVEEKVNSITDTPAFKAWFSGSEVVDASGKPLVVYHGTSVDKDFDSFDSEGFGMIFFSSDPSFASMYGGAENGRVMPCYLKVEHLFDYRKDWRMAMDFWEEESYLLDDFWIERLAADYYDLLPEQVTDEQKDEYGEEQFAEQVKQGNWVAIECDVFIHWLRELGCDGLTMLEHGSVNYAVFSPNQVKSAIGNNGDFDPESSSIIASHKLAYHRVYDHGNLPNFNDLFESGNYGIYDLLGGEDDWQPYEEEAERLAKQQGIDLEGMEQEDKDKWIYDHIARADLESRFNKVREFFSKEKFPLTVYRAIDLKDIGQLITEEMPPKKKYEVRKSFGHSWAWDEKGANNYGSDYQGSNDYTYIFRGLIASPNDIDWDTTLQVNFMMPEEHEIRVRDGCRIEITGYKKMGGSKWISPKESFRTVVASHNSSSTETTSNLKELKSELREDEERGDDVFTYLSYVPSINYLELEFDSDLDIQVLIKEHGSLKEIDPAILKTNQMQLNPDTLLYFLDHPYDINKPKKSEWWDEYPLVFVTPSGVPYLYEGNHRASAALLLNIPLKVMWVNVPEPGHSKKAYHSPGAFSDTVYPNTEIDNDPELDPGEGTNGYANMPERVEGDIITPSIDEMIPEGKLVLLLGCVSQRAKAKYPARHEQDSINSYVVGTLTGYIPWSEVPLVWLEPKDVKELYHGNWINDSKIDDIKKHPVPVDDSQHFMDSINLLQTDDGTIVVDGNHRIAAASSLDKGAWVRIVDVRGMSKDEIKRKFADLEGDGAVSFFEPVENEHSVQPLQAPVPGNAFAKGASENGIRRIASDKPSYGIPMKMTKKAHASDYLPSFEEFVNKHGGIEKLVYDYDWHIGEWFDRDVDEDDFNINDYVDRTTNHAYSDEDIAQFPEQKKKELKEQWLWQQYLKLAYRYLEDNYDALLYEHDSHDEEFDIFRCMTLANLRQLRKKNFGVYWSWDERAADAHWGNFGSGESKYTFWAKVFDHDVDWDKTLLANLDPSLGDNEKEVRLKPGIKLTLMGYKETGDREWRPINAGWKHVTATNMTQDKDRVRKQEDITDTPAFKAWFAGSKVVDDHGRPLRVYHGTTSDFDQFTTRISFFTNDPSYASDFSQQGYVKGGKVLPCYLSLKNPYDARPFGYRELSTREWAEFMGLKQDWARDEYGNQNNPFWYWFAITPQARNTLIERGYDGVVSHEQEMQGQKKATAYITFYPSQIKSAIGNNGEFDENNPNITASKKQAQTGDIYDYVPRDSVNTPKLHEEPVSVFGAWNSPLLTNPHDNTPVHNDPMTEQEAWDEALPDHKVGTVSINPFDVTTEFGEARGAIVSDPVSLEQEFVNHYGIKEDAAKQIIEELGNIRVAILRNINIWPQYQGNGYGSKLLKKFEQEAKSRGAKAVVLMAYPDEEGLDPLKLYNWYERHGYERVDDIYQDDPIFINWF